MVKKRKKKGNKMFKLGDEVKDKITSYSGIVTAITTYLNGCTLIGIQSKKLDKDGQPQKIVWFDEPQVELISSKKMKGGNKNEGGPMRSTPNLNRPNKQ